MKRFAMLILALALLLDLAEDGYLGKVTLWLFHPSAKNSITSCHSNSGPGQTDFQYGPASPDVQKSGRQGDALPIILYVPPTLPILHCFHGSSAGGIPLIITFPLKSWFTIP
jgi:hypothetical protein